LFSVIKLASLLVQQRNCDIAVRIPSGAATAKNFALLGQSQKLAVLSHGFGGSGLLAAGFVPGLLPRPARIERRSVCLPNAVYPSCANAASIFCSSLSAP
jgi:hypothetical protein